MVGMWGPSGKERREEGEARWVGLCGLAWGKENGPEKGEMGQGREWVPAHKIKKEILFHF